MAAKSELTDAEAAAIFKRRQEIRDWVDDMGQQGKLKTELLVTARVMTEHISDPDERTDAQYRALEEMWQGCEAQTEHIQDPEQRARSQRDILHGMAFAVENLTGFARSDAETPEQPA